MSEATHLDLLHSIAVHPLRRELRELNDLRSVA